MIEITFQPVEQSQISESRRNQLAEQCRLLEQAEFRFAGWASVSTSALSLCLLPVVVIPMLVGEKGRITPFLGVQSFHPHYISDDGKIMTQCSRIGMELNSLRDDGMLIVTSGELTEGLSPSVNEGELYNRLSTNFSFQELLAKHRLRLNEFGGEERFRSFNRVDDYRELGEREMKGTSALMKNIFFGQVAIILILLALLGDFRSLPFLLRPGCLAMYLIAAICLENWVRTGNQIQKKSG